jgi:hypothetical protein
VRNQALVANAALVAASVIIGGAVVAPRVVIRAHPASGSGADAASVALDGLLAPSAARRC